MLDAAAGRLHRQGFSATGVNDVLADAEAPRGSLYFHFPGGKEQLAAEAVTHAAAALGERLVSAVQGVADPVLAVRKVLSLLGGQLVESGYELGCPVATVALELTASQERLQQACAGAYASWEAALSGVLVNSGQSEEQARARATVVLSAIEGALVLARAYRSSEPLDRLAAAVPALVGGVA